MRVLVCEFVTGGGLRGEALPASLAREGAMMRDALIRDLADAGAEVLATHDERLPPPAAVQSRAVAEGEDVWEIWSGLAARADLAFAIAPETGGLLSRLTGALRAAGVSVIGPDDETIAVATSKRRTAERLTARGLATPPVWDTGPEGVAGPFVVKPDDGAGCEATRLVEVAPKTLATGEILQPFVTGDALSLTVLQADGVARLLSVNRQHVEVEEGAFRFRGLTVAAHDDPDGRFAALARAVGDALPGLAGVFGIDLVLTREGPVVIEVNPRLTTAYCGLREAIGQNPARLLAAFGGEAPPAPSARPVEIFL